VPPTNRRYVADHFGLVLDGVKTGFVKHVEGGNAVGQVVVEKNLQPPNPAHKHIGGVKYESITLQVGLTLQGLVYDWISGGWAGNFQVKDGSIVIYDAAFKPVSERQFFHALLTETTFPTLDAASKSEAFITVKFQPENTRMAAPQGTKPPALNRKAKIWAVANFRLEIDGLDCKGVSKIDSFTVRQVVSEIPIGEGRDYGTQTTMLEFPNLRITLSAASAQSWQDWFDKFIIEGNNAADNEKNGAVVFLAPDHKTELGRVKFFGLGIFKLAPENAEDGNEQMNHMAAELYCQRMEFSVVKPVKA
jgi:T4-like virus tail tube protein gp19